MRSASARVLTRAAEPAHVLSLTASGSTTNARYVHALAVSQVLSSSVIAGVALEEVH